MFLHAIRTTATANLLLVIAVVAGYILYGNLAGLPIGEHFFGMRRGHLGRGRGPLVPAWTFYAISTSLVLLLFLGERFGQWGRKTDRVLCLIFAILFLLSFLVARLPHRVIFPEDEVVVLIPPHERIFMWYYCLAFLLYALAGPNDD